MHDNQVDQLIISIVQTEQIAEQSDLQKSLSQRGFDIPQATLSRRLKKLKIAKVAGIYQAVEYTLATLPVVLNIQVSDYGLIVLHTNPGNANSLAYYLDRKYVSFSQTQAIHSGILGTIAGDDTLLLIIKSRDDLNKVCLLLEQEFPYIGKITKS